MQTRKLTLLDKYLAVTHQKEKERNMEHRDLLARLALVASLLLLATGRANATEYDLCNRGSVEVRFAVALRSGNFLFGYSWNLDGWYAIPPGKCEDAYLHKSDSDPDEPIYVAIAFTDKTGVWGAMTFDSDNGKEARKTRLCVSRSSFGYHLSGNINLPCEKSGYYPFPAALYFEPVSQEVSCSRPYGPAGPAECSGGPETFDFAADDDSRATAVGPQDKTPTSSTEPNADKPAQPTKPHSAGIDSFLRGLQTAAKLVHALDEYNTPPKPFDAGTLNAVLLGKKIVRRSTGNTNWYYEVGSRVNPVYELDGQTQSYLLDPPMQRAITDPKVVAARQALQGALGSWSWTRRVEMLQQGRLFYSYHAGGDVEHQVLVNIATLDFARGRRIPISDGLTGFEIPCKGDQPCAIGLDTDSAGRLSNNHIHSSVYIYFVGDENATPVWSALQKLRDLYPAEPIVVTR